jgi:segregation and condensation protein A
MAYLVELSSFHGPLDLLLYLVKKEEVEIWDIPIARVADQYLEYLRTVKELDVEFAGEFLVLAATLMEIKSRSLLPENVRSTTEGPADDPRQELVRQLLEYRRYKDAAAALEYQAHAQSLRLPRQHDLDAARSQQVHVRSVEIWDLVSAFARLVREVDDVSEEQIAVDETPQQVHEDAILEFLRKFGRVHFREIFTPPRTRPRLIGLFLAMLELIKARKVELEQDQLFGDIWVSLHAP